MIYLVETVRLTSLILLIFLSVWMLSPNAIEASEKLSYGKEYSFKIFWSEYEGTLFDSCNGRAVVLTEDGDNIYVTYQEPLLLKEKKTDPAKELVRTFAYQYLREGLKKCETESGFDARGYRVRVDNGCNRPIQITLFLTPSELNAPNSGTWKFGPNEGAYLGHATQSVRTLIHTVHYYAQTLDGAKKWSGEKKLRVNGADYLMVSHTDKEGETHIRLDCSEL